MLRLSIIGQHFEGLSKLHLVEVSFVGIGSLEHVFLFVWIAGRAYFRFRGTRLVTCPETGKAAAVELDVRYAAFTAPLGKPDLQLKDCSRWPERQACGQRCLGQIESAPKDCLVRTILTKWYEDKACIFCGKALGEINWLDHKPALMSPERVTLDWDEIPGEKVPEVLTTHMAVCWDCHIAERFRRRYPELVVDRPWRPGESQRSR